MFRRQWILSMGALLLLATAGQALGADPKETKQDGVSMNKEAFGKTPAGEAVDLYTLTNAHGMKVQIMTYGGVIVRLIVPDSNGKPGDVTLGFDNLDGYLKENPYFGALVGRYGNRIAKGKFTLDGKEYTLAVNNDANALHGGLVGFNKKVWKAEEIQQDGVPALKLSYLSKDGEEGYPGNLQCTVIYSLSNENEFKLDYSAETDKATPLNLTNHAYFNLAGQGNGDILNHIVVLNASKFTPVDKTLIPTGELRNVEGTPFDFTLPHKIGERIGADDEQIQFGGGYDHNFVLNKDKEDELSLGGVVYEPNSGRQLEFFTTQPGVQFYTGNFLDGTLTGKEGKVYQKRYGFCLETQHYPDSPNQPNFPTSILKPGEKYHQVTVYKFSAKK